LKVDVDLDAVGLNCPLPLLKLKQKINSMPVGQVIRVLTSDRGSVRDFSAFVKQAGHTMLESSEGTDTFLFIIRKEV